MVSSVTISQGVLWGRKVSNMDDQTYMEIKLNRRRQQQLRREEEEVCTVCACILSAWWQLTRQSCLHTCVLE